MKNSFVDSYRPLNGNFAHGDAARATTMRIPYGVLLDASGSMREDDNYSRAVEALCDCVRQLKGDENLAVNVCLYVSIFGNRRVQDLIDSVPLYQVDPEELKRKLLAVEPYGNTPMVEALSSMLDRLDRDKAASRESGANYCQPLIGVISDGCPTDSVDEVERITREINRRQEDNKLVFLPVGIGSSEEEFRVLDAMLAAKSGAGAIVIRDAGQLRKYFRLIGSTARELAAGKTISYISYEQLAAMEKKRRASA